MPRITSGFAKNKKLVVPEIDNIRSVQDITKQAIFAILTQENVTNATCLDLYAGTGSLGLEALSRGAKYCDFVDDNKKAVFAITENLKSCNLESRAQVHRNDAIKYVANTEKTYDLIFADPFYDNLKHRFLFKNFEEILNEDGLIIFLHGKALNIENQIAGTSFKTLTQRRYNKSYMTILSR